MKIQYKTKNRQLLLEYLSANGGRHVTAQEITEHFKALGVSMGTTTVSRQLERFVEETGVKPVCISCATGEGIDEFKATLREIVRPETRFHHTHAKAPDLSEMPDTTGEEVPAEAIERFATFLKLEKPKAKSHPSRGNIH